MRPASNSRKTGAWTFALLFVATTPAHWGDASVALWATPCLLLSALLIAWGAESAQFFIAQGFALAILAWLQTLPEFAVEAVLAWRQQVPFLFANLSGALRLLTGLGWPLIYVAAATVHRKRTGTPLGRIRLEGEHSVSVLALLFPVLYALVIWWKHSLTLIDSAVLMAMYAGYLWILSKMPPEDEEGIEDLERVPRYIVQSPRGRRIALIALCFGVGGALIYFSSEPFVNGLIAVASLLGIPSFVFIQWVAPFVSEFPEMASTFYWARTVIRAPMALMNMVSSNINQWTLLMAMLPIVYSMSRSAPSAIPLDPQQELELLMTIGQALVGMLFLINMELAWWEAAFLFVLWFVQFAFSTIPPGNSIWNSVANHVHPGVTYAYFVWAGWEVLQLMRGKRKPAAVIAFREVWRKHVRTNAAARR